MKLSRGPIWAAQLALPVAAALIRATAFTTRGSFNWDHALPSDLDVYVLAAQRLLLGQNMFATQPGELPWLYGPMAAVLFIPLVFLSRPVQWFLWTALNAVLVYWVVRLFGVRGWMSSLVAAVAIALMWPITHGLDLGQIGVFLMALVVWDWKAGRPDRRSWWRGIGTGIATMVKMTPAFFAVVAFFAKRARESWVAFGTFVTLSLVGFFLFPADSVSFWQSLLRPIRVETELARVGNQSMMGAWLRTFGLHTYQSGLLACVVIGILGLAAAIVAHRRGHRDLALCVAGFAALVAAPLSWAHQFTWVLPLALVAWFGTELGWWVRAGSALVVLWLCSGFYDLMPLADYVGLSTNPIGAWLANLGIVIIGAWFVAVFFVPKTAPAAT